MVERRNQTIESSVERKACRDRDPTGNPFFIKKPQNTYDMDVRKEYFRLKELNMHSTGEDRVRADEALEHFLNGLNEADKEIVFKAIEEDFASLHRTAHEAHELKEKIALRKQLEDVLPLISVSALSKNYFGKSSSWFYQRLNGNLIHGKPAAFTEAELKILADSIGDLGQRLSALSNVIHRSL